MGALEIWNKSDRMNLSNVIFLAIQSSTYFKELFRFKTYHEVVQEIRQEVMSIDPWIKGTRTPSTCMCLLFKLFTLRLTVKQLKNMLKDPSQTVRAMAVLYLRLCCKPQSLWEWLEPLIDDDSELTLVPSKPAVPFGLFVIRMVKEQHFFDVLLPRIPVPIHKKMLDSDALKAAEQKHILAFNTKVGSGVSGAGASTSAQGRERDGQRGRGDRRDRRGGERGRDDRRGGRDDRHDRGYGRDRSERGRDYGRKHRRYDDRRGHRSSRERYGRDSDRHGRGSDRYGRGRDGRDSGRDRYWDDRYRDDRNRKRYRSRSRSPSPSKRRRTDSSRSCSPVARPTGADSAKTETKSASATFEKLRLLYGSGGASSAAAPAPAAAAPVAGLSVREQQRQVQQQAAALDLKHTGEDVVRIGF